MRMRKREYSQSTAHTAACAAKDASKARAKAVRDVIRAATQEKDEKVLSKMREGRHDRRLKLLETTKENVQKHILWCGHACHLLLRAEFEKKRNSRKLDCVLLWGFILETHLTHIFGVGDPMKVVNALEQLRRFPGMRQGEREFISSIKTRLDNQVKANEGAGVPQPSERKFALEFIMKLDPKRYKRMLAQMRNDSLRRVPDAYPSTLASAFRIASG
jgi:hypothetical protein